MTMQAPASSPVPTSWQRLRDSDVLASFRRNRVAMASAVIVLAFLLLAAFAPLT